MRVYKSEIDYRNKIQKKATNFRHAKAPNPNLQTKKKE